MKAGCRLRLILFGLLLLSAGCKHKDQLEAELRSRDIQYRELLDDFDRIHHHNYALEHELGALRQGVGGVPIPPEAAAHIFTVQKITLGKMTGGQDIDGCYGDDGLLVVVEPRDCEDQTLKAPGALHVMALEINSQGIKTPIGAWDVAPDQLRKSWKSGWISNGYAVTLPLQGVPASEKVRVLARLVMPDGRAFEADKDVKIRLACRPHPLNGPPPVPGGPLAPGGPLPPPGSMTPPDAPLFMPRSVPDSVPMPAPPSPEQSSSLRSAIEVGQPVPLNR